MTHAIGIQQALEYYGVKLATVPRATKQFRRAFEMLHGGDRAFYGTRNLTGPLSSGTINPGQVNRLSPPGVSEVYMGDKLPAGNYWGRHSWGQGVVVPRQRVLANQEPHASVPPSLQDMIKARRIPGAEWSAAGHGTNTRGVAEDWLVTPHHVPLEPKDTIVHNAPLTPDAAAKTRGQRLRTIPSDVFRKALDAYRPAAKSYYGDAKLGFAKLADGVKLADALSRAITRVRRHSHTSHH